MGSILSKSLIQFSVDGQDCVPSLLFDLGPNYGRSNEGNGYLFCACTAGLSAQEPVAGRCWPPPLLEISGHSWASLSQSLGGHCSFLLGPGAHKVLFVPSKSLFLLSCVSSGDSVVGLMATSSKRAYTQIYLKFWVSCVLLDVQRTFRKTGEKINITKFQNLEFFFVCVIQLYINTYIIFEIIFHYRLL